MPRASEIIESLPDKIDGDKISVSDVVLAMDNRSLLVIILFLTVPNLAPFVNALGITQITGILLLIYVVRMMMGIRQPWLPQRLLKLDTDRENLQKATKKVVPWLKKLEKFVHPRLRVLAVGKIHFFYGLVLLALTIVMLLPIPFVNVIPALFMTVILLALIQRDGLIALISALLAIAFIIGLTIALNTFLTEVLPEIFDHSQEKIDALQQKIEELSAST